MDRDVYKAFAETLRMATWKTIVALKAGYFKALCAFLLDCSNAFQMTRTDQQQEGEDVCRSFGLESQGCTVHKFLPVLVLVLTRSLRPRVSGQGAAHPMMHDDLISDFVQGIPPSFAARLIYRKPEFAILPCGHFCLCLGCAGNVQQ